LGPTRFVTFPTRFAAFPERKEVIKAIMGIRRRVSPGLSGWKAEHLQSALKYSGKAYKAALATD